MILRTGITLVTANSSYTGVQSCIVAKMAGNMCWEMYHNIKIAFATNSYASRM